jgi:hypothetical protein
MKLPNLTSPLPRHFTTARQDDKPPVAEVTMLGVPLNIPKFLKENGHLLQPPINNYCVYDEHVTVMVIKPRFVKARRSKRENAR